MCLFQNLEWALFRVSISVEVKPFGEGGVASLISKHGHLVVGPSFSVWTPSGGQKNMKVCKCRNHQNTLWIDQTCMLFNACVFRNVLLTEGQLNTAHMHRLKKKKEKEMGSLTFTFVLYHLRHGVEKWALEPNSRFFEK